MASGWVRLVVSGLRSCEEPCVTKEASEAGSLSNSLSSFSLGTNSNHALKNRTMFTWSRRAKMRTSRSTRRLSSLTLAPVVSTTFFTA